MVKTDHIHYWDWCYVTVVKAVPTNWYQIFAPTIVRKAARNDVSRMQSAGRYHSARF